MFDVIVSATFTTKTEEQARYISKFFEDGASLMTCENSVFVAMEPIPVSEHYRPRRIVGGPRSWPVDPRLIA